MSNRKLAALSAEVEDLCAEIQELRAEIQDLRAKNEEIRPARKPGRVDEPVVAIAEEEDAVQARPAPEQKGSSWLRILRFRR